MSSEGKSITRFVNGFKMLCKSGRNECQVWSDICTLFAIEIQNTLERHNKESKVWQDREELYKNIAKKYDEKQRTRIIPQMFAALVMEYNKNFNNGVLKDILGDIYMKLEISSKNNGQFFTPQSVSDLMASVSKDKQIVKKAVKEKGFCSVYDCACGAGVTLLSGVQEISKQFKRLNWQNHVIVYAQDIDVLCVYMTYIQLSLYAIPAIVCCGNTLTEPVVTDESRIWRTPLLYVEPWSIRRLLGVIK